MSRNGGGIVAIAGLRGRKAEAFAFICSRLATGGGSPTMQEIADALRPPVSRERAKQLVHQLAVDQMIQRPAGSQRGISVPRLVEHLQALGWRVNPGEHPVAVGFPKGQLPLMPAIRHVPDDFGGMSDDGD